MGGRRTAALAVSIMTVLALGACGSGGGTDPSGAETSSTATTDSPTDAPSESLTASPTEPLLVPEAEAVEPASGPRLDVSEIRVNIPKGWKQTFDSFVVDSALGRVDGKTGGVLLSVVPTGGDVLTPKQAESYFWTRGRKPQNYQKQDDILMGGLTAGYYTARDRFDDIHAATLWEDNHVTKVEVSFDREVPDEVQQELFQSVVASYSSERMRL
jgi:hypothetical protein